MILFDFNILYGSNNNLNLDSIIYIAIEVIKL
jgi:hypothetical protein